VVLSPLGLPWIQDVGSFSAQYLHVMASLRSGLWCVGVSSVVVLAGGSVASAAVSTGPEQTAQLLRSSPVFIADDSEARGSLDVARLRQDIGSAGHVYVAVLPARSLDGTTRQTAAEIGGFLHDDSSVVIVIVGRQLGAAQGPRAPLPPGDASRIATTTQGSAPDLQAALDTTITEIRRDGSSGGAAATTTPAGTGKGSGGSGSGALVGVLAVLIAAGGALLFWRRRKTNRVRQESTGGLRAEVDSLYARLGSDVSTLNAGSDAVTQQALVDASERYTATGSLLADSRATPAVLAQAKRTAIEGIMATRVARQRLGLDLGPDPMPTPPPSAPQVQGSQPVTIDGQAYTGYGQYQPGAGHYFGGGSYQGRYIPGGWYSRPFWQTAAISAVAFGGLGYALGGGFGGGFGEDGYERDDDGGSGGWGGDDRQNGGGGDWGGGGGGGDWGGGGGGGGDWGGGGGWG